MYCKSRGHITFVSCSPQSPQGGGGGRHRKVLQILRSSCSCSRSPHSHQADAACGPDQHLLPAESRVREEPPGGPTDTAANLRGKAEGGASPAVEEHGVQGQRRGSFQPTSWRPSELGCGGVCVCECGREVSAENLLVALATSPTGQIRYKRHAVARDSLYVISFTFSSQNICQTSHTHMFSIEPE